MEWQACNASLFVRAALLTGVKKAGPADPVADGGVAPEQAAAATADSAAIPSDAPAGDAAPASEAAATPAFDIEAVPVSDAALGEFPYFSLHAGYEPMNRPVQMDYARFPFWTGEGFEWVEGRSYETSIAAADGKTWSEFELRKHLETRLTGVGAVKVTSSKIPAEWTDKLEDYTPKGHIAGLGAIARKTVVRGTSVSVRVELGGRRTI